MSSPTDRLKDEALDIISPTASQGEGVAEAWRKHCTGKDGLEIERKEFSLVCGAGTEAVILPSPLRWDGTRMTR